MIAGNFGHFDNRETKIAIDRRLRRGILQFKRNIRFAKFYPMEVHFPTSYGNYGISVGENAEGIYRIL